jgi:hypothetical protein
MYMYGMYRRTTVCQQDSAKAGAGSRPTTSLQELPPMVRDPKRKERNALSVLHRPHRGFHAQEHLGSPMRGQVAGGRRTALAGGGRTYLDREAAQGGTELHHHRHSRWARPAADLDRIPYEKVTTPAGRTWGTGQMRGYLAEPSSSTAVRYGTPATTPPQEPVTVPGTGKWELQTHGRAGVPPHRRSPVRCCGDVLSISTIGLTKSTPSGLGPGCPPRHRYI